MNPKRIRRNIRLALFFIWGLVFAWLLTAMQAKNVDPSLGVSSVELTVIKTKQGMQFIPHGNRSDVGLLFFPGALVDPEAYIPLAREVADAGFPVTLIHIPFRFPSYSRFDRKAKRRAKAFMEDLSEIDWVIGGHSRGAKMASYFVHAQPDSLAGLLMIGSTHPRETNMQDLNLPILKISASEDGLATPEEIEQFAGNLPEHTRYVMIEGGNHAQFGWYGRQLGDRKASLNRRDQHQQTVSYVLAFLREIETAPVEAPSDMEMP